MSCHVMVNLTGENWFNHQCCKHCEKIGLALYNYSIYQETMVRMVYLSGTKSFPSVHIIYCVHGLV